MLESEKSVKGKTKGIDLRLKYPLSFEISEEKVPGRAFKRDYSIRVLLFTLRPAVWFTITVSSLRSVVVSLFLEEQSA